MQQVTVQIPATVNSLKSEPANGRRYVVQGLARSSELNDIPTLIDDFQLDTTLKGSNRAFRSISASLLKTVNV
jgi:hypothetical protein